MPGIVIDTSAVLANLFREPTASWINEQLASAQRVLMSTVNLTEAMIRFRDRKLRDAERLDAELLATGIEFVAPDTMQAAIAARARFQFPLNLGDCFAYALAKIENLPLLTLDRDFRAVDIPLILPPGT